MRALVLLLLVSGGRAEAATLYDRLGGKAGLAALVDEWLKLAGADKRVKGRFVDVDLPREKARVADCLCKLAGGGCACAELDMQLVDEEWQALVEDLDAAMLKRNLPEKQELISLMRSHQKNAVHPPPESAREADNDLMEKAKQLATMLKNVGKVKPGELLEEAVEARARGQRSHAEHLYSVAETQLKPEALAILAPLFRQGGPPRVSEPPRRAEHAASPAGSSDDDESQAKASLTVTLTVDGHPRPGVVMLAGGKRRPARAAVVEVRGGELTPRLLVVPVGSTVAFANFDAVFHDLFSLSPAKTFDLGYYKDGTERQVTFDKEGVVRVADNLRPDTAAYVVVTGAPWFAAGDGTITLRNLAPGRYKLRAFSDGAAEPSPREVNIHPGANQLTVELKGAPLQLTDKFGVPLSH